MNQRNLYISDLHLFHNNVTKSGKDFDNRPYQNKVQINGIMQCLKRFLMM